jgi:hypothetical protein
MFAEGTAYPIEEVVPVARRGKEIEGVEIVGQGCRSDGRALMQSPAWPPKETRLEP